VQFDIWQVLRLPVQVCGVVGGVVVGVVGAVVVCGVVGAVVVGVVCGGGQIVQFITRQVV
jgi:hypothetical protein